MTNHDLVGALHLPGDSVVSAPDVNHALAVASAAHGVQIYEHTSVNHVVVKKGHVKAVETDRGSIECEYFVNCAGQWTTNPWGMMTITGHCDPTELTLLP